MNSIKSIGKKLSCGTAEIYSSIRESLKTDKSDTANRGSQNRSSGDFRTHQMSLESEVHEVRRLMNEEIKLEREAREIIRRRSTAHSVSTASSFSASGAPSRSLSALETPRDSLVSFDEELFADFETHEAIFRTDPLPEENPFIASLCELNRIDEFASSLNELSDASLKNVIRQLLVLRPAALHSLKEALN